MVVPDVTYPWLTCLIVRQERAIANPGRRWMTNCDAGESTVAESRDMTSQERLHNQATERLLLLKRRPVLLAGPKIRLRQTSLENSRIGRVDMCGRRCRKELRNASAASRQ